MKESHFNTFIAGIVFAVIFLMCAMQLTQSSPKHIEKRYENEAINLGYATNVIVLKKDGEYGLEFQWITNK